MQKSLFQILPFLLILSLSCGESEEVSNFKKNEEKGISLVNSVIQITGQDFNQGSSSSGFVKGEAVMKIIPSESEVQVIVKYRYIMSSGIQEATERGHLENFKISDDGVNNTKIIRADWINQDAGNGTFVLKSYSEDDPKTIIAQINSKGDGNWYHSTWVELTDEEYDKFLKAVSVNEESLVDKNNSIDIKKIKEEDNENIDLRSNNTKEDSSNVNYLNKISGIYEIKGEAPDYIPQKISISVKGLKIKIDNNLYSYYVKHKKNHIVLEMRSFSDDSGDFLGGGDIVINGSRINYIMFFGVEAEERYSFEKVIK